MTASSAVAEGLLGPDLDGRFPPTQPSWHVDDNPLTDTIMLGIKSVALNAGRCARHAKLSQRIDLKVPLHAMKAVWPLAGTWSDHSWIWK